MERDRSDTSFSIFGSDLPKTLHESAIVDRTHLIDHYIAVLLKTGALSIEMNT